MPVPRATRLAGLEERWHALREVFRSRAEEFADDPRGRTGYYTRTTKNLGNRENPVLVTEYSLDTKLLREIRATEQQIAIERGEWKRGTFTGPGSVPVRTTMEIVFIDPDPQPGGPPRPQRDTDG